MSEPNKPYAWWWDTFRVVWQHLRQPCPIEGVRLAALAACAAKTLEDGIDAGDRALFAAIDDVPFFLYGGE